MVRVAACTVILTIAAAWSQVATEANRNYQTAESRAAMARALESEARNAVQKPEAVVAALGIGPGATVADIGTGVGYMLPYLSKAVGVTGLVLGEDIQSDFLSIAQQKIAARNMGNVKLILGTETDPKLPRKTVDLELLLDVYHHFNYPDKMLAALSSALRNNGRIAILEYYKSAMPSGHIRLDRDDVIREVEGLGFRLVSKKDHMTSRQYLLIFAPVT